MAIQTKQSIIDRVASNTNDHDCPYGKRLINMSRQTDPPTHTLSYLADQLRSMHTEGKCPPTHIGNSPTLSWSEWVKDTNFH